MKRRQLLFGAVTAATGVGMLTGAGGVSESDSHRRTNVTVVSDENGYIGTEVVIGPEITLGAESNCQTTVDLLEITNQSKFALTNFGFEVELTGSGADAFDVSTQTDLDETLATGESGTVRLTIGSDQTTASATVTVTVKAETSGSAGRFELHRQEGIRLEADCAVPGPEISILGFVPTDGAELGELSATARETVHNEDGEVTGVAWETNEPVAEAVIYAGREWYVCDCNGATGGQAGTNTEVFSDCRLAGTGTSIGDDPYRCPNSPGHGERCLKYDTVVPDGLTGSEIADAECSVGNSKKKTGKSSGNETAGTGS